MTRAERRASARAIEEMLARQDQLTPGLLDAMDRFVLPVQSSGVDDQVKQRLRSVTPT